MDTALLNKKFDRIGARLKVVSRSPGRFWDDSRSLSLDVHSDRRGEFFEIAPRVGLEPSVDVLDVQPTDRHLLLLVREGEAKSKYLCGHDERHWFVAGIPEASPVGTVEQAKRALQPREVRSAVARKGVSARDRNRRKNAAFIRQGEWFFLPADVLVVDELKILRSEPLSRGTGSKPHWAEYCYRTGGRTVFVCHRHPEGVPEGQYRSILARNTSAKHWGWRIMRSNPRVYVRGRIRHADHATVTLHGWHLVVMNTENQSRAMRNVTFLD